MLHVFYNSEESRLRAGWRIIIFTFFVFLLVLLLTLILPATFAEILVFPLVLTGLLWPAAHYVDKRPVKEYGLYLSRQWIIDFIAGNVIAAVAMTTIFLIQFGMDWLVVTDVHINTLVSAGLLSGLLFYLASMAGTSLWEELYFRSYLIKNLQDGLRFKWIGKTEAILISVVLSSVIFGLAHSGNPNASAISNFHIGIAGMVLAYPYITSNSIAIPIGMHLSWNYFQGAIYGLPVSGIDFEFALISIELTGPEEFTGGSFGPEAGAAGLLGLMVMLALYEVYNTYFYKKRL